MNLIGVSYEVLEAGPESFHPDRLQATLADDLASEGPVAGTRVGAEGFVHGVGRFAGVVRHIDQRRRVIEGKMPRCSTTPSCREGRPVVSAEFFEVAEGKIRTTPRFSGVESPP